MTQFLGNVSWPRVAVVVGLAIVAFAAVRLLLTGLHRLFARRFQSAEDRKRLETLDRALRYITNIALTVAFFILLMSEFGISVAPILGAAGIVGIAVGFAAQSLVKDFFRGVFLLLENQIRLGDVVEIAGKSGKVEEVTLRYVRLRDDKGSVHFVSNGEITTVTNMSIGFSYSVVDVRVPSSADLDRVMEIMRQTAAELEADEEYGPRIIEPFDLAGVADWQEFSVVLRGRFKTGAGQAGSVKSRFLERVRAKLMEADVPLHEPVTRLRA
ncbi:MAG: mechanosensitive ion channel family protein [Burkholderiaceae bacterium]